MKRNILSLQPKELETVVYELGEKRFRADQIFGWLAKGITSFEEMRNVSASLRGKLEVNFYIGLPRVVTEQRSSDGTVKCLYEFQDGARVESVFMKYSYGNSVCISSQAGCRMGCSFCASTLDGLERNLEPGEMLGEVIAMKNLTGEDIRHVVVMGMGEPFDNYEGLSGFINLIHSDRGYGLSMRAITVSTCGIIPGIKKFGEDFPAVNLAVSLHAPNGNLRKKLMPVANAYGYEDLLTACREYTELTGRRITFEYSMISGVNDSADDAKELASHLEGWLTHVNLIPLNRVEGKEYEASQKDKIAVFKRILEEHNVAVTVRRTLGSDIDAACGQLRNR